VSTDDTGTSAPVLRVVGGGEPSPEELAALVVALGALAPPPPSAAPRSGWGDRRQLLRKPLAHGPGRWTASTRPSA